METDITHVIQNFEWILLQYNILKRKGYLLFILAWSKTNQKIKAVNKLARSL